MRVVTITLITTPGVSWLDRCAFTRLWLYTCNYMDVPYGCGCNLIFLPSQFHLECGTKSNKYNFANFAFNWCFRYRFIFAFKLNAKNLNDDLAFETAVLQKNMQLLCAIRLHIDLLGLLSLLVVKNHNRVMPGLIINFQANIGIRVAKFLDKTRNFRQLVELSSHAGADFHTHLFSFFALEPPLL